MYIHVHTCRTWCPDTWWTSHWGKVSTVLILMETRLASEKHTRYYMHVSGGTRTHDTLHSRQSALPLSYQGMYTYKNRQSCMTYTSRAPILSSLCSAVCRATESGSTGPPVRVVRSAGGAQPPPTRSRPTSSWAVTLLGVLQCIYTQCRDPYIHVPIYM